MKYKAFKKCTKNYEEIYTKEKETKEIHIELDGIIICITEHQLGLPIKEPYVNIIVEDGWSYGMDLSEFIKKITT